MSGWIKLHRQLLSWEWYSDANCSRLFIHALLKANHAASKWRGIDIKRGQFITSLDKLEAETGLSKSQIRTCLKKLISTNEIAQESNSQHTVITIVSYDSYQCDSTQDDKPAAYESQTDDIRMTTNKNDKNENTEKKYLSDDSNESPKVKKIRFSKPTIDDVFAYFVEMANSGKQIKSGEHERFFDYYESKGWLVGKSPMKDWKAAARNWVKNNQSFNTAQPQQQTPPARKAFSNGF